MMSKVQCAFCFEKLHSRGEMWRKGRECKFQNIAHRSFDIINNLHPCTRQLLPDISSFSTWRFNWFNLWRKSLSFCCQPRYTSAGHDVCYTQFSMPDIKVKLDNALNQSRIAFCTALGIQFVASRWRIVHQPHSGEKDERKEQGDPNWPNWSRKSFRWHRSRKFLQEAIYNNGPPAGRTCNNHSAKASFSHIGWPTPTILEMLSMKRVREFSVVIPVCVQSRVG